MKHQEDTRVVDLERARRLARIRQRIRGGDYRVDLKKLAMKILAGVSQP